MTKYAMHENKTEQINN